MKHQFLLVLGVIGSLFFSSLYLSGDVLEDAFTKPGNEAKPWVFWYWHHGAVSKEGITKDIEAMASNGIGGAYLMPIKGPDDTYPYPDPTVQLTDKWWDMLRHAFTEADRNGIKLGMHASDGFALAGGPWITPEMSMQRLVWTTTYIESGDHGAIQLPQPLTRRDYYKDVAVMAFPSRPGWQYNTAEVLPEVSSNIPGIEHPDFLCKPQQDQFVESSQACWIQYSFKKPFLCRSVTIRLPEAPNAYQPNTYHANRLIVQISDDGKDFKEWTRLEPPRHGWQDGDLDYTHSIPAVTAKYFRFVFDPRPGEPGAEDLDSAKWDPKLKLAGIDLSGSRMIHQYEGKSGAVWRISSRTDEGLVENGDCIAPESIIDLSDKLQPDGTLAWSPPAGDWTILRFGHTTTAQENTTGGGGIGLECDKFRPDAIQSQFEGWFGESYKRLGQPLASKVLKIFHVDSWECGSQNWSPVFPDQFRKRCGYDILPLLPVMAGIPVESVQSSENVLKDVRSTIAELVSDVFFDTLSDLSEEKDCLFSAESVAPTMVCDGMAHFREVDIPMGEFWLKSATHDKINDILDAVSGAHVYGKNVVQAESYTQIRLSWDEYPSMLKPLGDRNFALGVNRLEYHVFMQNPWLDRSPGMTLDGVGLYFQRNQTWWDPARAWVNYVKRCQGLLQQGHPVVDIGVFTGEDIPRRSIVPWHLQPTMPGFIPEDDPRFDVKILKEEDWINVLGGYNYDSINPEALLKLAKVKDGLIQFPGGVSYRLLVMPASSRYNPSANLYSPALLKRVKALAEQGAKVLFTDEILLDTPDTEMEAFISSLPDPDNVIQESSFGKGTIYVGKIRRPTFEPFGIQPDLIIQTKDQSQQRGIVWNHRSTDEAEFYFVANQTDSPCDLEGSFWVAGLVPEIWDPVTGEIYEAGQWQMDGEYTRLPLRLEERSSLFVVFRTPTRDESARSGTNWYVTDDLLKLKGPWHVQFEPASEYADTFSTDMKKLKDWSKAKEEGVRHFSGTATYSTTFKWSQHQAPSFPVFLDLGEVCYLGEVILNGKNCGVAWTAPWRVDVSKALQPGENNLEIRVTNTWFNRIEGDRQLPEDERSTWTTAPERTAGKPLMKSGLIGPVKLLAGTRSRD